MLDATTVNKILREIIAMLDNGDSKELIIKYINGAQDVLNATATNPQPAGAKPLLG